MASAGTSPGSSAARPDGRTLVPALLVALLALAVRGAFLCEMRASPLFAIPFGGAAFYHGWGEALAAGRASGEVYYHAPLYAYVLGGLYRVFGSDPLVARVAQAFLGAAGAGLLVYVGRVFLDRRAGIVAGLLLALWPSAILADALHKKTSLELFLLLATLAFLARAREAPRPRTFAAAGLVLSLLGAARENALVLGPIVLAWIALGFPGASRAERARRAVAFAAAALLLPLAIGVRNLRVAGEFLPGTANSGANFWIGNHRGASGLFEPLVPGEGSAPFDPANARALAEEHEGRALGWREVSRSWWRRGIGEVVADPLAWARLLARKALYLVSAARWVDDHELDAFDADSRLLAVLGRPLRYGLLAPLGLAGLVLALSKRRLWLLAGAWIALGASLVLFFLAERFRMTLLPLLLLFAVHAVAELVRAVRARRLGHAGGIGVLAGALALLVHWPTGVAEWPRSATFNFLGLAWQERGDPAAALGWFERALEDVPGNAAARFNAGRSLLLLGREVEAREHLEQAARLEPAFAADAFLLLGEFHAEHDDLEGALALVARARELDPLHARAANAEGVVLRRLDRVEEAVAAYAEAVRLDGRLAEARNNLAWLLATDGRVRDGRAALEQAERAAALAPEDLRVRETLAAARAASGDFAGARAVAEELRDRLAAAGDADGAARVAEELAAYGAGRAWGSP
jgi:Flp pilus assembly protein TadD